MSKNYDNWERLVAAVLLKEELKRLAFCPSMDSSCISSRSSSFNSQLHATNFDAIKDLDFERFLRLDNNNYQELTARPSTTSLSFFLDETTGKKSFIVGARDLKISLGNILQIWKWTSHPDSRFSEVAELETVGRLKIRGKIKTEMLEPRTVYAAHLIFKTSENVVGLESAKAMVRFVNDESKRAAAKRAQTVHLQPMNKDINKQVPMSRDDGWMEVELGNFYVSHVDRDGEVEARLLEIKRWKTGLIVEGISFRPTSTYTKVPLISKKYMSTNVLA